jgi:hypothetical protein
MAGHLEELSCHSNLSCRTCSSPELICPLPWLALRRLPRIAAAPLVFRLFRDRVQVSKLSNQHGLRIVAFIHLTDQGWMVVYRRHRRAALRPLSR